MDDFNTYMTCHLWVFISNLSQTTHMMNDDVLQSSVIKLRFKNVQLAIIYLKKDSKINA